MPLVLDSANVVVRGNFNPYIFSPEWLANQEVWDQQEVHLALGVLSDGIRFRSVKGDVSWEIDSKTFAVSSMAHAGSLVACVLRKLSHTPVIAVGCNYSYSAPEWGSYTPKLGPLGLEDLPKEMSPELVKWTGVFHERDVRIDMSVACGDQGATIAFNFHQSVTNADEAATTAERFEEFKDRSRTMIKTILGEDSL